MGDKREWWGQWSQTSGISPAFPDLPVFQEKLGILVICGQICFLKAGNSFTVPLKLRKADKAYTQAGSGTGAAEYVPR